uniref:Uncharacterized protein n=1 Tax=Wuchereria bancrofti TaxID=6293 RepID=A0AAF5RVI5_WUCBA
MEGTPYPKILDNSNLCQSPATRPGIFGRLIRKRNTDAVGLCQSEEEKNYTKEVKGLVVKSKKVRSKVPKLSNYYYLVSTGDEHIAKADLVHDKI